LFFLLGCIISFTVLAIEALVKILAGLLMKEALWRDFRVFLWHDDVMDYEFDKNDRKAIEEALADPSPLNPIAQAVAARIEAFIENLAEEAERSGRFPQQLLLRRPQTAFDDIVIRLTLQTLADELGQRLEIHWV
jgi:hypothetical protein